MPHPHPQLLARLVERPVLVAHIEPAAPPPKGPLLAFAGIGKPWKFERALKEAGAEVFDFAAFADHKPYDEATLNTLAEHAKAHDAQLITTEKDWARLPAAWRERVTAWPIATSTVVMCA